MDNPIEDRKQIELDEILSNVDYGKTEDERYEFLAKAELVNKIILFAEIFLIFCYVVSKNKYLVLVLALFPLVYLVQMKYFKGLVTIFVETKSAYPSIFLNLFCLFLFFFCVGIYDKLNIEHLVGAVILIDILIIFITYLFLKGNSFFKVKDNTDYLGCLIAFVIQFFLIWNIVSSINYKFDDSKPQKYTTSIIDKFITSGKHSNNYHLTIDKWGPQKEIEDLSVPKKFYDSKKITDTITITFWKGKFDIPYYDIEHKFD